MLTGLKFFVTPNIPSKKHQAWKRIARHRELAIEKHAPFSPDTNVFVLGSCFANEIRFVLERAGIVVHPRVSQTLGELFDQRLKVATELGEWNERAHYGCFTPFSINQELKIAFGKWRPSDDTIYKTRWKKRTVHCDPYRRSIFARSREDALRIRTLMNTHIREGIAWSEVLIFTLGLVEAFRLKGHGGFLAEYNSWLGKENLTFVNGAYESVMDSLSDSLAMIRQHYPDKHIVLTVSPVPMARTFSNADVVTATTRAKSILYACADTLAQSDTRVHYWPSYDYAMWSGTAFQDDLRHIRSSAVREITTAFCAAYFGDQIADQAARFSATEDEADGQPQDAITGRILHFLRRRARAAM